MKGREALRRIAAPAIAAVCALSSLAAATTVTVGQGGGYDYSTIQAAIDAATTGDAVVVHPGTYVEHVRFDGKNIRLRSTDPTSPAVVAATVIDGGGAGRVVAFDGTETSDCVLSGFTIRNGKARYAAGILGGRWNRHGRAAIENNTIAGNSAIEYGGGLTFCDGEIRGNTIARNSGGNMGGGLAYCDGLVLHNRITSNSAELNGGGLYYCGGTIHNNEIVENTARYGGGLSRCDGLIRNCTIAANSADRGGGLFECKATILNSIVWGNGAEPLRDSANPRYSCIEDWTGGGIGNIRENPLFVSGPFGDYYLSQVVAGHPAQSPCVDGVSSSALELGLADRVTRADGIGDDGIGDMGYHYAAGGFSEPHIAALRSGFSFCAPEGTPPVVETLNIRNAGPGTIHYAIQTSPSWLVEITPASGQSSGEINEHQVRFDLSGLLLGSYRGTIVVTGDAANSPVTIPVTIGITPAVPGALLVGRGYGYSHSTIQSAIDAATTGDTVVVAPGRYIENIHFRGKSIVLRSAYPTDPETVAVTIIDGRFGTWGVTFAGSEDESCVLSGFMIRNVSIGVLGSSTSGRARGRIENNVITECKDIGVVHFDGAISGNDIVGNLGHGLNYCYGVIRRNRIAGNAGYGLVHCGADIRDNLISQNRAGLYRCDGLVQNNVIHGNHDEGGLIACNGTVRNNLIAGNRAPYDNGGGLRNCRGIIQNNTIVGNEARNGGGAHGCRGKIESCIFWGNRATEGPDQLAESSRPTYSCIEGWTEGGVGNINTHPAFVDLDGPDDDPVTVEDNDYHLADGSPCIDTGQNAYWLHWPVHDLDGNGRLARGHVDMGCYEFGSSPDADGDLLSDAEEAARGTDPNRVDTDGDTLADGLEVLRGSDPCAFTEPGTIHVPADLPTIQAAIVVALDGEEVVVSPGVYVENVDVLGRNIVLRSTEPQSPSIVQSTVIDGDQRGSVLTFAGSEGSTCVLSGFTISHGQSDWGGGINARGSHARIEYNVIANNTALWGGGGIASHNGEIVSNIITANHVDGLHGVGGGLYGCNALIHDNVISDNQADYGGGLEACGRIIRDNVIANNSATYGGGVRGGGGELIENEIRHNKALRDGGGICDFAGSIHFNLITGNRAWYGGGAIADCSGDLQYNRIQNNEALKYGGGVWAFKGPIHSNLITGNRSSVSGGGIAYCSGDIRYNRIQNNFAQQTGGGMHDCSGRIWDNLISDNKAARGGGLHSCNDDARWTTESIRNNTIAGNWAYFGGGVYDTQNTIENCILWGNMATSGPAQIDDSSTPTYSCIQDWTGGGKGNINANPLFVDPDGLDDNPVAVDDNDYRLRPGSPCIDAGREVLWSGWPVRDLDGNCRVAGGKVDMGCYEFGSTPDTDGDLLSDADERTWGTDSNNMDTDGDGLEDGVEILRPSDPAVFTPPGIVQVPSDRASIQEAIIFALSGDVIVVAPGHYVENIHFLGKNITLQSTDPLNPEVVANTILNGNAEGSVVTFAGTEGSSCVLSGFTLRNMKKKPYYTSEPGGGIVGNGARATIQHNVIAKNTADLGAWISNCNGTIRYNEITANSDAALSNCNGLIHENIISGNNGDGLSHCNGLIENNVIENNQHSGLSDCDAEIRENRISGNNLGLLECDGLVFRNSILENNSSGLQGCDGVVVNNLVAGNKGRGFVLCDGRIENNRIVNNSTGNYVGGGGLLRCGGIIRNNTIVANSAPRNAGGLSGCWGLIENCIVWGNTAEQGDPQIYNSSMPTFSCIEQWTTGGIGNIGGDPAFVDPTGPDGDPMTYADNDYHLSPGSPCIDAGNPATEFNDGDRPPGLGGERNDMGAYGGPHNGGWLVEFAPRRPINFSPANAATGVSLTPTLTSSAFTTSGTSTVHAASQWQVARFAGWPPVVWDSGPTATGLTSIAMPPGPLDHDTLYFWKVRHQDGGGSWSLWSEPTSFQTAPSPTRPDLALSVTRINRTPISTGEPVVFSGSVANRGSAPLPVPALVEFRLVDEATGRAGYLCDSLRIVRLDPGVSFDLASISPARIAYESIRTGIYTIEVRVDPIDAISETDESNNRARLQGIYVLKDRPNLSVAGFEVGPRLLYTDGGEALSFSGTIFNNGVRPTTGPFWVEFRLWRGGGFYPDGPLLCDSMSVVQSIAPGESVSLAPLQRLSYPLAPGTYTVGVVVDAIDEVFEQDEQDNVEWLAHRRIYVRRRQTAVTPWRRYR